MTGIPKNDSVETMVELKKACLCCGEDVAINRIVREGQIELACANCGFVIEVVREPSSPSSETSAPDRPPAEEALPAPEPPQVQGISIHADCIVTADDVRSVGDILKKTLLKNNLAREVIGVQNGRDFIKVINQRLSEDLPVDLVILDLEMPDMDGFSTARIMRALEEKHQSGRTPIIFFSAQKCDNTFKRLLHGLAPARYIYKGLGTDTDDLFKRVNQLVTYLLRKLAEAHS